MVVFRTADASIICWALLILHLFATGIRWCLKGWEASLAIGWPPGVEERCRPVTLHQTLVTMPDCKTGTRLLVWPAQLRLKGLGSKSFQCTKWISIIEISRAVELRVKLSAVQVFDAHNLEIHTTSQSAEMGFVLKYKSNNICFVNTKQVKTFFLCGK